MIKAILFDMDGILYDSEGFYYDGNYEMMVKLGYTGKKEDLLRTIGKTIEGTIQDYYELLDHKVALEKIAKEMDFYYQEHPISYKELAFPKIKEMIQELHQLGFKMACCSSSPLFQIKECLVDLEIDSYFTYIQSGEEIEHPKPNPEIYQLAMKHLGVQPDECIIYEDSDLGIASGKSAGGYVVARIDHRFGQSQKGADYYVQDIEELVQYIKKEKDYAGSNQN